jgi:hypothetical protein
MFSTIPALLSILDMENFGSGGNEILNLDNMRDALLCILCLWLVMPELKILSKGRGAGGGGGVEPW